jgi:hypothetical protein
MNANHTPTTITEPAREIPVLMNADVVVVGVHEHGDLACS